MVKFGLPAGGGGLGAASPLCVTARTPFPSASSSQLQSSLSRVPSIVPPAWLHMNTDCGLTTDEQQGDVLVRIRTTNTRSRNPCCREGNKFGSMSGTRAISTTARRDMSSYSSSFFFSCKARHRRKFTPF